MAKSDKPGKASKPPVPKAQAPAPKPPTPAPTTPPAAEPPKSVPMTDIRPTRIPSGSPSPQYSSGDKARAKPMPVPDSPSMVLRKPTDVKAERGGRAAQPTAPAPAKPAAPGTPAAATPPTTAKPVAATPAPVVPGAPVPVPAAKPVTPTPPAAPASKVEKPQTTAEQIGAGFDQLADAGKKAFQDRGVEQIVTAAKGGKALTSGSMTDQALTRAVAARPDLLQDPAAAAALYDRVGKHIGLLHAKDKAGYQAAVAAEVDAWLAENTPQSQPAGGTTDAVSQGQQPGGDLGQRPQGNGGGQTARPSGGNQPPSGGQVAQEAQGQTQGEVASNPFADELGETSQPASVPVRPGRQSDGTFRSASRNEFDRMSEDERKSYLEQYDEAREQDKKAKATGQTTKDVTAVPPATPADQPQPAKRGKYQSNPQPVGIHNDRYDATLKAAERDFRLGTDTPNLAGLRDLIDEEHDGLIGPSDRSNPRGEENRRRQAVQLKALADAYEGATGRKLTGVRRDIDALLSPVTQKASAQNQPQPQQPTVPTPQGTAPAPQPTPTAGGPAPVAYPAVPKRRNPDGSPDIQARTIPDQFQQDRQRFVDEAAAKYDLRRPFDPVTKKESAGLKQFAAEIDKLAAKVKAGKAKPIEIAKLHALVDTYDQVVGRTSQWREAADAAYRGVSKVDPAKAPPKPPPGSGPSPSPQGGPVPQPTGPQPVTPDSGPKPMPFDDPNGMAASTDTLVKGNPDYYLPALDSILKRELATLAKTTDGPNYLDRVRKIANLMTVYENNAGGPYAGRPDFEGMAGGYLQQPKPPEPPTAQQELEAAIPGLAPVPVGKPIPVAMPVPNKPRINKKPGGTPAAKSAPSPDQPVKAGGPVPIDSVVRMAGNPQSEQNLNLILAKRGPVKPGLAKSMLSDLAAAVRGGASEVTRRISDRTYRLYYDRDPETGKPQLKFKEDIVPLIAGEPAVTADTGEVVPLVDAAKSNTTTGGGAATLGRRIRTTKPGSAPPPRPAPTVPESPAASPVPGAAIRFPVKAGKPVEPTEPSQGLAGSVREAVERDAPKIRQQLADRGMVDEAKVGAIIESAAQAVDYALNNSQPSGSKPSRTYVDLGEGDDTVKAVLDVFPAANGRQRYVLRLLPNGQQSPAQSAPAAMDPGSTVIRPTTASGESSLGSGPVSSPTTPGSTLMPAGGIVIRNGSSRPEDATPVDDDSSLLDADVTVKPVGSVGPDDRTPLEIPLPSTPTPKLGGDRRPIALPPASVPTLKAPEQVAGPMPDPVYALDQNLWRLDINTPKDVAAAKGVIDEAADFIRSSQGTGEQTILVGNQPVKVFVDRKGVQLQFPDGDKVPYSPTQSPMSGGRPKAEEVPGQPSLSPDRPSDAEPSTKPWFTPGTAPPPKGFRVLSPGAVTSTDVQGPPQPKPESAPEMVPKTTPQPTAPVRRAEQQPPPVEPVTPVIETEPPVPAVTAVTATPDDGKYVSDLQKFKRNNYQFPMAMPRDGSVNPALWQEFDALRKGPMRREFERGDPASRESLFKKLWDMDGGKYRPLLVPPAVKKPTKVAGPAPASIRVAAPGVASPPPPPTVTSAPPPVEPADSGDIEQSSGPDDSYVRDYLLRSGGVRTADVQSMGRDAVRQKLASLATAAMAMPPNKLAGVAKDSFMTVPELMDSLSRLANPSVETPKSQPEEGPLAGLPTDPKARVKSIRSRIKKLDQKMRGNITDAQKSVLQAKIDTLQDELSKSFDGGQTQLSVTIPRRRPLAFTVRSKLLGV